MLPIRPLALPRIAVFANELRNRLYSAKQPVRLAVYHAPGRIAYDEALQGEYQPASVGEQFGPKWSTHWFRVEYRVPKAWAGGEVHLLWDSSSEACIFIDGVPQQAFTGTGWGERPVRTSFRLLAAAQGGETATVYVEMAANHLFGVGDALFMQDGLLRQAEIGLFEPATWKLLWDIVTIGEMAQHLPSNSPRAGQALAAALAIINLCDVDQPATFAAAEPIISAFFAQEANDGGHEFYALGHAHLDTAWLWPLGETRRKAYRTVANTLRLLEDYPEYRFSFSQAQQYAWMKEMHPALYEGIKRAVAEERILPVGGMWVEPDCNVPSGESLVRQFVHGQRFFETEFGVRSTEAWLPDTFGYPAALPTIIRGAGIKYFLTQKLSWNQFNKPYRSTFYWEGLDGSRVLAHFPPSDTYNSNATVEQVLFSVQNFKDHDRSRLSMYLYGYGDGGAGPNPEMLERLRRITNLDGMPRIHQESSQSFFDQVEAELAAIPPTSLRYSIVRGELYFELHRGTYTTQARTKANNRRTERLLHDIEVLASVGYALGKAAYPAEMLDGLWKTTLLNQFHDILPGSSITEVYRDADADYAQLRQAGEALRGQMLDATFPPSESAPFAAVNTLGVERTEIVDVSTTSEQPDLRVVTVPAMGVAPITAGANDPTSFIPVSAREEDDGFVLENGFIRAHLRRDGRLVSYLFKADAAHFDYEAVDMEAGGGNQLVLYRDRPMHWDAWDVDLLDRELRGDPLTAESASLTETHPLRGGVTFTYRMGESSITQIVSLTCLSPLLEFEHQVSWHASQQLLRAEFAVNVHADHATYETQYGVVQRPTHSNTTYDLARFEVSAQRWADLYEPGFGMALLNDNKYGYSVDGNVMGVSLLRATTSPDPDADQGDHAFRLALLPHRDPHWQAGLVAEGLRFNTPLLLTNAAGATQSYFSVNHPSVILDTVKKAEVGDDLVVRLYEAYGSHAQVTLTTALPIQSARFTNLIEDDEAACDWQSDHAVLHLRPFQIMTLRLMLG